MKIFKSLISLLLIFISFGSFAQMEKKERDFVPSELYLSADLVGVTRLFYGDIHTEFQAKVDFDQYYLAFDYGYSVLESSGEDFDYKSRGNFFRIGPQVNFIPYNKLRNSIYFGVMYGNASFSDEISYSRSAEKWPDEELQFNNEALNAQWMEMNLGINARIYKNFYLGYVIRYKFGKKITGVNELEPYEIPGFGRADKKSVFGFNYYVTYRIPFRDKPIPKKPVAIIKNNQEPKNEASTINR